MCVTPGVALIRAKAPESALITSRETRSCPSLEISGHAVLFSNRDRMDQMEQRETVKRSAGSMQHMLPGTRGDLLSVQSHHLNSELDLCCQTFLRLSKELHKAGRRERADVHEPSPPPGGKPASRTLMAPLLEAGGNDKTPARVSRGANNRIVLFRPLDTVQPNTVIHPRQARLLVRI